jgi:hypothetical protein
LPKSRENDFYSSKQTADGYKSQCKACHTLGTTAYGRTEKGRAGAASRGKRYWQSEIGRANRQAHAKTDKAKNTRKKRNLAQNYAQQKKYNKTDKGRRAKQKYLQSEKGSAATSRYLNSELGQFTALLRRIERADKRIINKS